jgi:hypothetical protein
MAADLARDRPQTPPPITRRSRGDRLQGVAIYHPWGRWLYVMVVTAVVVHSMRDGVMIGRKQLQPIIAQRL